MGVTLVSSRQPNGRLTNLRHALQATLSSAVAEKPVLLTEISGYLLRLMSDIPS